MAFEVEAKTVTVDGNDVEVSSKEDLVKAIQDAMRSAGLKKAKVFIDGTEVSTPAAITYDSVEEGADITLKPYDKAAK